MTMTRLPEQLDITIIRTSRFPHTVDEEGNEIVTGVW